MIPKLKTIAPTLGCENKILKKSASGSLLNFIKYMIKTPKIGNKRPKIKPSIGALRFIALLNKPLRYKLKHAKTSFEIVKAYLCASNLMNHEFSAH